MATIITKTDIDGVEWHHYSNGVVVTLFNGKFQAINSIGTMFYSHPDKSVVMAYVEHLFKNLK